MACLQKCLLYLVEAAYPLHQLQASIQPRPPRPLQPLLCHGAGKINI